MSISARRLSTLVILVSLVVMCLPLFAHAGAQANAMCVPVLDIKCPCGPSYLCDSNGCGCKGPTNKFMCKCQDTEPGGITVGHCVVGSICHGDSYSGGGQAGGGTDSGLSALGKILGDVLGKLMQPSPSSGGGAPPPGLPTTGATGCQGSYFQTSDITQLSNPCAQYVPPATPLTYGTGTSTGGSGCDTLGQLLGTCGTSSAACPVVAISCAQGFNEVAQTGTDANGCQLPDQCILSITAGSQAGTGTSINSVLTATGTAGSNPFGSPAFLAPGLQNGIGGDILFSGNGATIFGNAQNSANNTGVAGFFGSDTFNGQQPQGLAAQMCRARPWASGFLGSILPVSFFDGLCTARGYQVGPPPAPAAPVVQLQQTPPAPKPPVAPPPATSTPTIQPRVQIWAVPPSIPLGTRTSIFWNTQGVTDCNETSPDGSFNQNSLSGGAATVPLTGATIFTISCLDTAGNPVTGYVTVNLSI